LALCPPAHYTKELPARNRRAFIRLRPLVTCETNRPIMRVLGIETTCDETAAAIVSIERSGEAKILSNEVLSQIAAHAAFGGVVPEIAARAHVEAIDRIVARAFETAGLKPSDIDAVAAAAGPGLVGGVMVGLTTAKAIALVTGRPFIAVNHLEAHALTARLTDDLAFPYLLLLVSGGHTQLLAVRGVGDYLKLGGTIDDAVGEAFDKIAKMLGLPYPGGPSVEREAGKGDPERFDFPRPMAGRPNPDFSLSGLKTAVRLVAERIAPLSDRDVADLCASFQAAVVDIMVERTRAGLRACRTAGITPTTLVVAGGVAANQPIRHGLARLATEAGLPMVAPPLPLCGDNGAMIAWAGLERLRLGMVDDMSALARPRWPLDELKPRDASKPASALPESAAQDITAQI
jgi:N6-L-threonylcarbamoyladenine synthase